jgi:AraC-like DNA-binding protein
MIMRPRSAQSALTAVRNWQKLAERVNYCAARLAEASYISERTLRRFFLHRFHCSLRAWLTKLRRRKAEQLIRAGERIKEIAARLGYRQIAQFSRWLKRTHGLSPRAWRSSVA